MIRLSHSYIRVKKKKVPNKKIISWFIIISLQFPLIKQTKSQESFHQKRHQFISATKYNFQVQLLKKKSLT